MWHSVSFPNSIETVRFVHLDSKRMVNALQYPALAVAVFGGAGILMQIIPPGGEASLLRYATEATFTSALIVAVIVLWRALVSVIKVLNAERVEHLALLNKLISEGIEAHSKR